MWQCRGSLQKSGQTRGKSSNLLDPPPKLYFGPLFVILLIAYLGFRDYEMDFEINLYFPPTKLVWHLEKNHLLPYIGTSKSEFF